MITTVFLVIIGLTIIERLIELRLGKRNLAWSLERGGVESGQGHWPWMVTLHTLFLGAMVAEALLMDTVESIPMTMSAVVISVAAQGLRWWCIRTLGSRWNPRVIVVPNLPRVQGGPYRLLNHPNYVAVAVEGVALPMIHGCWRTAAGFTLLNAVLMVVRIRCENDALTALDPS